MFARRYTYGGSVDREWDGWCSFFRCHLSDNIGIVSPRERGRLGQLTARHGLRQVLCILFFFGFFISCHARVAAAAATADRVSGYSGGAHTHVLRGARNKSYPVYTAH